MSNNILINVPVKSVNGETGIVTIDYTDVGAAATVHTHSQYIEDADSDSTYYARYNGTWAEIPASSGGDMVKSTYDTNDSGVVDDAEALDSQTGSYYLDRNNHSGSQSAATITNFDSEVASTPAVSLNTDKISFPEAALDGNVYGRQLGSWSKVTEEAPIDGRGYIRKNSDWSILSVESEESNVLLDLGSDDFSSLTTQLDSLSSDLGGNILVINLVTDSDVFTFQDDLDLTRFYNGTVKITSVNTMAILTGGYRILVGNSNFIISGGVYKNLVGSYPIVYGVNILSLTAINAQFWHQGSATSYYYFFQVNIAISDISFLNCSIYPADSSLDYYYLDISNSGFSRINFADCGAIGSSIEYLVTTDSGTYGVITVNGATSFYSNSTDRGDVLKLQLRP